MTRAAILARARQAVHVDPDHHVYAIAGPTNYVGAGDACEVCGQLLRAGDEVYGVLVRRRGTRRTGRRLVRVHSRHVDPDAELAEVLESAAAELVERLQSKEAA